MSDSYSHRADDRATPIINSLDYPRVLFVHGLLMTGHESMLLARRFARSGLRLERFRYASRREGLEVVAVRLAELLCERPRIHVVTHSLGGLIMMSAVARAPRWLGRAVLLGPPLGGSETARALVGLPGGSWWLGEARETLTGTPRFPSPPVGRIAVIAGTRNIGIGTLLRATGGAADGVVRVAETRLAGAAAIEVHANHVGLLFNRRVAAVAAAFIREGRLLPA